MKQIQLSPSAAWAALNEEEKAEFWATLALRHTKGLGLRSAARLLRTFGSALQAVRNVPSWKEAGIHADKAAVFNTGSWRTTAQKEWLDAQQADCRIILWTSTHYPSRLKEIYAPPPLLYSQGDISLLNAPILAIVGARRASPEGRSLAASLASEAAKSGITIVSGMADGIDSAAHAAALCGIGRSIGVLGTGIEQEYPSRHGKLFADMRNKGLLISEFAPKQPAIPANFPVRNRIISGLSLAVLVLEAAEHSGSLITAREALEQNRGVYVASPQGRPCTAGSRALLDTGARIIFSAEEIIADLAPQLSAFTQFSSASAQRQARNESSPAPQIHVMPKNIDNRKQSPQLLPEGSSPLTQAIAEFIYNNDACHADIICQQLNISASDFNSAAIFLEMAGYIQRLSGGRYSYRT